MTFILLFKTSKQLNYTIYIFPDFHSTPLAHFRPLHGPPPDEAAAGEVVAEAVEGEVTVGCSRGRPRWTGAAGNTVALPK
jgi:hypothetical protein